MIATFVIMTSKRVMNYFVESGEKMEKELDELLNDEKDNN